MRAVLLAAALILAASVRTAGAEPDTRTAAGFLEWYGNGQNYYARVYMKGLYGGYSMVVGLQKDWHVSPLFCPPPQFGRTNSDAEVVSILTAYVDSHPSAGKLDTDLMVLTALREKFPCGGKAR